MPYSIETADGITIDNIPDNVPKDAATLKERVAKIRQERGMGSPSPAPTKARARMDAAEPPNWFEKQLAKLPDILSPKAESAARGFAMGAADPSVGAAQLVANLVGQGEPVNKAIKNKEQEYDAGRAASGREGFDAARLTGNIASPANLLIASKIQPAANTVKSLAAAGAKAGAVGGAAAPVTDGGENYGLDKALQVLGGTAGGAVVSPIAGKAVEGVSRLASAVRNLARPAPNVNVAINNMMTAQGINPADFPPAMMQSVSKQVQEALDNGAKLDPAAIMRKAQFESVGLIDDAAPTMGQMTRDPMQFAKEKNLSGINLDGQNPLATRFQTQQQRLGQVFDDAGASGAVDRHTAGEALIASLQQKWSGMQDDTRAAYSAFRDATGKDLDVPLAGLSQDYANTLRDFGDTIPSSVRREFEGLGLLTGDQKKVFSIDDAEQLIKTINKNYDPSNVAQARALKELHKGVQRAIGSIDENGMLPEAAQLAKTARETAKAGFDAREAAPAFDAAIDNAAPDNFIQQFVLNRNAPARDVAALRDAIADAPEAQGQLRAQVADFLKKAAFGENPSGDKAFSADRYMKTLEAIGPQKLQLFFSPEEIVRLNNAGKVASDIVSEPAGAKFAIGRSGTAQAAINTIMSILGHVPGGGMLGVPLNFVRRETGNYQTQKAIQEALKAAPEAQGVELPPEVLQLIQRLSAGAALAPGVAAAQE